MDSNHMGRVLQVMLGILCLAFPLSGKETVYLSPDDFLEEAFDKEPELKMLWLTRDIKAAVEQILGHGYKGMRLRYWESGGRTAWILDEIGKVEPITAGFLVEDEGLVEMKVLIYRESHGWEVRYPFFTTQFRGLSLDGDNRLSGRIDGISGATLSVNALERLARLALYLHGEATR